jgi:AraC-like DNA-binding protein
MFDSSQTGIPCWAGFGGVKGEQRRHRPVLLMPKTKHQLEVACWRAPELGGELLKGRFSDFSYEVHTHETACFALLTRGAIRIRMRGQDIVARKGDLYAIEADEPHAGSPLDAAGWKLRTLYVDTGHLRSFAGDERRRGSLDIRKPILRDLKLASMLYAVHHCSQIQGPRLEREELYLAFATRLIERHVRNSGGVVQSGSEGRAIKTAREFIHQHIDRNISLREIAEAAGLPAYQLYRGFEKSTGMTPHAYQRQARVRLAVKLIRAGLPLGQVAFATGFSDQAHLTRWFRRMLGVTPGSYQQAMQA